MKKLHILLAKKCAKWYPVIGSDEMLKEIRKEKGLTQERAATLLGVSRRTYISYEQNEDKIPKEKIMFYTQLLGKYGLVDEEHGILSIEEIKSKCADVFRTYEVQYAYLFGSYAKQKATEKSDVDLLVSMPKDGLRFYALLETLREKLKKKVDMLDADGISDNPALLNEILKDGIKIYG